MRVFVTRRLPLDPATILPSRTAIEIFAEERAPSPDELLAGARDAEALICLVTDTIGHDLIEALPHLKVIANVAVGYNNIDLEAASDAGIWVTNTPGVLTDATADLTWALILATTRRVGEGERLVRRGDFHVWSPTMLLGLELSGRTVGIFGFGRIGQAVARRARGFGMRVLFTNRSRISDSVCEALGAKQVSKEKLLAESDVLSIHCPLTDETRHAISRAELDRMKPSAYLVNTSRGPVVDEAALAEALARGVIAGAGLDVYEEEPTVHPALLELENVVLLPHIGSATRRAREAMARIACENARAVLEGKTPPNPVNQPR